MTILLSVIAGLLIIPAFIVLMFVGDWIEEKLRLREGLVMQLVAFIIIPVIAAIITATLYDWWRS